MTGREMVVFLAFFLTGLVLAFRAASCNEYTACVERNRANQGACATFWYHPKLDRDNTRPEVAPGWAP